MVEYWDNFVNFILKVITTIFGFFQDMFYWTIDNLFYLGQSILSLLSFALEGLNPLLYIDSIPNETKAMMSLVGFNESMGILISAIIIRFMLQLIPFVRWGS